MNKKSKAVRTLEEIAGEELTFANMMRNIRQTRELTQAQFGDLLGVKKSYICDIEKGRTNVTIDQAIKFAAKLEDSKALFIKLAIDWELKKNHIDLEFKLVSNG